MTTLKRRFTRVGNRIGVWMYRTLDGRLSRGSRKVHVLMITTPGRRTGIPRSTCVRYLETDEGYVVWGTGSGSQNDPDWFRKIALGLGGDDGLAHQPDPVDPDALLHGGTAAYRRLSRLSCLGAQRTFQGECRS